MQQTNDRSASRLGLGEMDGSGSSLTRRALFCRMGGGFGALGLTSVLADAGMLMLAGDARAATSAGDGGSGPELIRWLPGRRTSPHGPSG